MKTMSRQKNLHKSASFKMAINNFASICANICIHSHPILCVKFFKSLHDVSALHTQNTAASFFCVPSLKRLRNNKKHTVHRSNVCIIWQFHTRPFIYLFIYLLIPPAGVNICHVHLTDCFNFSPKHGHGWNDTCDSMTCPKKKVKVHWGQGNETMSPVFPVTRSTTGKMSKKKAGGHLK